MASIAEFENHCWSDVIDEDTMKIYSCYARETKIGDRPAILAIDLYNIVYRGGDRPVIEINDDNPNTCGEFAHAAIAPTQRLLAAARRAGLPIFFCTQETRPQNRPQGVGSTRRQAAQWGAEDFGIYEAFEVEPQDVIITKQRASIFQGTPIVSHLNYLGVKSLIVCGESTSGCVRASCVDAYSNGFHVSIVEECVYDRSALIHKVNLFDLHHKYCDVMHLDEVVETLDARFGARIAAE
jgi:maleamate amidohydrolase